MGVSSDGLHIHHKCHNPKCVNPAHLEVVTPRKNAIERRVRRKAKIRLSGPAFERLQEIVRGHIAGGALLPEDVEIAKGLELEVAA